MSYSTPSPLGGDFANNCISILENSSNCPNETYVPYSLRPETYVVPVVFAIIFVVGVLGNGVLVITICSHSKMWNVPNTYVLSLAVGDLLVILTCVPFTIVVYVLDSWPFGLMLCKITECVKDISIGVSVFTLTALSADRFFAIVDPMKKLNTSGGNKKVTTFTKIVASTIWLFAIACSFPASFSYIREFRVNRDVTFKVCYPYPEEFGSSYPKTIVICRFCILYLIPLIIIAVFYLLMARHLLESTRSMPGEIQGRIKQVKARKKVAKMVMTFVLTFALCFLPQHIFMLWFHLCPTAEDDYDGYWHYFRILGFCLAFMNSCINPIALYCVSGSFRKYFNRYLCCKKSEAQSDSSQRRGQSSFTNSKRTTSSKRGHQSSVQIPMCPKTSIDGPRNRSGHQHETTVSIF